MPKETFDFTILQDNMNKFRVAKGLTLRLASAQCGLIKSTRWEHIEYGRARPTVTEIAQLARFMNASIDHLLNWHLTVNIIFVP